MDEENWRHDTVTRVLLLVAAGALVLRAFDALVMKALSMPVRLGLLVGAFVCITVTVVKMRMNAVDESD